MGYKQTFNPLSGTFDSVLDTDSPAFTGTPTVPTQAPLDSSTKIATTEYVDDAVATGGGGGGGVPLWQPLTNYTINEVIVELPQNKIYIAGAAHTSSTDFIADLSIGGLWAEVSAGGITPWAGGIFYNLNDLMIYTNIIYICTSPHTSSGMSPAFVNWAQISSAGDFVLKTGDTMSGNLQVASASTSATLGSGSLNIVDTSFGDKNCQFSPQFSYMEENVFSTNKKTTITGSSLQMIVTDTVTSSTIVTDIGPETISLYQSDGVTNTPAAAFLPEHVTTKSYVDAAVASAIVNPTFNAVSVNSAVVPSYDFTAHLPKGVASFAPVGICTSASWSPDGKMLALATTGGNFYSFFDRAGIYFSTLTPSASIAPAGAAYGTAWSSDGRFLATAHATTPFITILQRTANPISVSSFTKLSNPSTLPTGTGTGVAWSPDGAFLSVSHGTTPFITIYRRFETTFDKLTNPASLPTGNGSGTAWSPDGRFLSVSHATAPFITIYERSGITFTKLADPAILPTGNANGVAWSSDGKLLVVSHNASPFITIYERSGTTFTKLTNPAILPTGNTNGVAWSSDNKMLAVGHSTAPFITIYERSGTTFTKIPDSTTAMTGTGVAVAFSPNNRFLVSSHTAGTTLPIWETSSAAPDIIDKVPKILGKLGE